MNRTPGTKAFSRQRFLAVAAGPFDDCSSHLGQAVAAASAVI